MKPKNRLPLLTRRLAQLRAREARAASKQAQADARTHTAIQQIVEKWWPRKATHRGL